MARFSLTQQAESDIGEILAYIAVDNVGAAIAFDDRLTELFEFLSNNTKAGRERSELKDDMRSFPEGNYVIFYRLWAGNVAIVRVLHSARDLDEIFS